eukprot:6470116-Amphidinium_carterae.2
MDACALPAPVTPSFISWRNFRMNSSIEDPTALSVASARRWSMWSKLRRSSTTSGLPWKPRYNH